MFYAFLLALTYTSDSDFYLNFIISILFSNICYSCGYCDTCIAWCRSGYTARLIAYWWTRSSEPVSSLFADEIYRGPLAILSSQASQANLNFSPAQHVSEPPYTGRDAAGHVYTDEYIWNLCGPGATTATLGYWKAVNLNKGTVTYSDPRASTTWNNTNYTSYVAYIATQTRPPAYTSAGEMSYGAYPNAYSTFDDVRDALNWEVSGHSSNYFNFFYTVVSAGNLSLSTLENDVQYDIYTKHVPLIVSLNDSYLPDWPSTTRTSHFVTILGYNFNAGTFTYDETCGTVSCNTKGTGIYTISISQLYNGMQNDSGNGGIVW